MFFCFKQKTAYEMRISDWSSDVCSSDLYRADALDPDLAQRLARDALAKADDGELYLQYRATESFSFDDGRLKTADYSTDAGFGLRAVSGEMTGFAHASDISAPAIRRAAETLALLDPAKDTPAGPPPRTKERKSTRLNSSHYCASRMPSSD